MNSLGFPLLSAIVLIPVVGAIVVAFLPKDRPEVIKATGFLFAVATGALTIYLLTQFDKHSGTFQFVSMHPWIKEWGISWHLGVDGISLFMVVLTGILFPLAIAGPPIKHNTKMYVAWFLVLEAGCLGSFLSLDLFLFFIFFESVLIPMYFLIGGWGYENRVYASVKFFLFTLAGSAFMLVGMLALVFLSAHGQHPTFDLTKLNGNSLAPATARWIFFSFAAAFAVKIPLFPLHTWLPDAHTEAPTSGSLILAAVLLKLGTYGIIRFGLFLFPRESIHFAPLFLTLAAIGIIYGAIVAVAQKDLKRLVAYSSIAHLGFIVLGTFALTPQGVAGGVLQNVNHGLSTGALFLLVGMIYERRHTRQIDQLRGLQKSAPVLAGIFTLVMFSSMGVPGLNGFVGEYLILLGTFLTHKWWAVVATAGVILAAIYLLWAYQRVFHGPADESNANVPDIKTAERWTLAPLLILIVALGVFPKPLLDRITPSVDQLLTNRMHVTQTVHPEAGAKP